ncbi:MAG TPA: YncE family protein [Halothiobacillus sp.]|nr:YncE family protein [Halothiobacillus sp.]
MKFFGLFGAFSLALLALNTLPAQAQSPYKLTKTIALGGAMKWDYLHFDPATDRLYVSHGNVVDVLNGKTGVKISELRGLPGSHGIAVDPISGLIYADSAKNSQAVAFDPKSFKPVATTPVVQDADGMVYDAASKQIFVAGGDGNAVTPISTITKKAAADIALGGSPEFLAVDDAGSLYVNINDKNEIVRIDTKTNTVTARWPVAPCKSPTGLAIDTITRRLFSSCHSGVMVVMNADTGKIISSLPIGQGTDAAAFDPSKKRVFSSNADGTLNIISEASPTSFTDISMPTEKAARTLAVNPASGRIFLVTANVTSTTPPATPGGRIHYEFAPGSVKLLIFDPIK